MLNKYISLLNDNHNIADFDTDFKLYMKGEGEKYLKVEISPSGGKKRSKKSRKSGKKSKRRSRKARRSRRRRSRK